MRKYCLTYDAIDSSTYQKDPDYFRELIIDVLIDAGCENFYMPVASTIIFNYEGNDILKLDGILTPRLRRHIYYYLCLVAENKVGTTFDAKNQDDDLEKNFDDFLKNI